MISLPHPVRVFLHTPATDLRKGFDALCGLVTTAFAQDPTSGGPVSVRQSTSRPYQNPLLGSRRPGDLVQAARKRLVPDPDDRHRSYVDRDDRDPIFADPLRHRPEFGATTQAVPPPRSGGRKSAISLLKREVIML